MSHLPRSCRVLALDLPGAGYSERSRALSPSFGGMASVLSEACSALDLKRPVIVGHSHGGALALELASGSPHLISGLILLCPAHPFSGRENALIRFYTSPIGHALAHMLPHLPNWFVMLAFRRMPGTQRDFGYCDIEPYLHTLRSPGTVDHLLRLLGSWRADMARLRETMVERPITTPVLLVWGDRDIVVPLSSGAELTRHMRDWELVSLPGVGHLPNEEAPEETAAHIRDWLVRKKLP